MALHITKSRLGSTKHFVSTRVHPITKVLFHSRHLGIRLKGCQTSGKREVGRWLWVSSPIDFVHSKTNKGGQSLQETIFETTYERLYENTSIRVYIFQNWNTSLTMVNWERIGVV